MTKGAFVEGPTDEVGTRVGAGAVAGGGSDGNERGLEGWLGSG